MSTRPRQLHVSADPAPGLHSTDTLEAIYWWTPTLGPTASIAAAHLADHAQNKPSVPIDVDVLRTLLGLGQLGDRMWRTLDRLERFDIIRFHSTDTITIRTRLPALSARQLDRLPDHLCAAYRLLAV